jgi:hypothetical protein
MLETSYGTTAVVVMASLVNMLLCACAVACLWISWHQLTSVLKLSSVVLLFILPGVGPLAVLSLLYFEVGLLTPVVHYVYSRTDSIASDASDDE